MYSLLRTGVQHCPEWGLCPQSLHWRELGFQETDWATFWVAGDQQATLFFSVRQGWVLLRRHRTGKGVPLHVPEWFQLKLFSCIIILLTWIFFLGGGGGGVEHQGHRGHTREITSLVLFEWLRGLWPSVPTSGWSHLVSFFWILGIGEHPSVPHTITSTLKQMTVTQGMLTFKESSNRQQANGSWLCPVHSLKAASKLITKHSIKKVTTIYVKTMEKIESSQKRSVLTTENKKKEKKKGTSKS